MARFIRIKDDRVINIQYIQDLIINSEDDTELIIYNSNGDKILEKYDTAEEAEDAYDSYKSKLTEPSGSGEIQELQEEIQELSETVAEQQQSISDLESEVSDAEDLTEDILGISDNSEPEV